MQGRGRGRDRSRSRGWVSWGSSSSDLEHLNPELIALSPQMCFSPASATMPTLSSARSQQGDGVDHAPSSL